MVRAFGVDQGWRRWAFDVVFFALLTACAILVWRASVEREATFRDADRAACLRIEVLKRGFRISLHRSLATLDSYAYYREHSVEKGKVIEAIHTELKRYAPADC